MQTRRIFTAATAFPRCSKTLWVENAGQLTRASTSALLWLCVAWGQNPQVAVHLPVWWVMK
jgi:hypothetical protein